MSNSKIWTTAGGCNQRSGRFAQASQVKTAEPIQLNAPLAAAPVCTSDGRMLVADTAGEAYSIDISSGVILGTRPLRGGAQAAPAIDESRSRIFAATVKGFVQAYDYEDGAELWHTYLPSERDPRILSDVLFLPEHNLVVVNSWGGKYVALNADNGDIRFTWNGGTRPYAAATADSSEAIYAIRNEVRWGNNAEPSGYRLVKVNPETGEEESLYFNAENTEDEPIEDIVHSAAPVIDEERNQLWFIENHGDKSQLNRLNLENGKIEPKVHTFNRHVLASPALLADGKAAVADMGGKVAVVSDNGSYFEHETGAYYFLSSPVVDSKSTVFACDNQGFVHEMAFTADNKTRALSIVDVPSTRSIFEAPRAIKARPAFSPDGHLLIACMNGAVYRI